MFELVWTDYLDVTKLALAGFLARYRQSRLTAPTGLTCAAFCPGAAGWGSIRCG